MDKKKSFWSNGLSIDETRMSALIIIFGLGALFAFYQVVKNGDIANGLLTLLGYLIAAITGVNISQNIVNGFSKKKDEVVEENTDYTDPLNGVDEK